MKKLLICLILAAVLLSFAAGCASGGKTDNTTAAVENGTGGVSESVETAADTDYYRNVDKTQNYGGDSFLILSYDASTWNIYLTAEDENGILLNDAAFKRNAEVESMLGIKIETRLFPQTELVKKIQLANASGGSGGSDAYDLVCFWATTNLATLVTTNAVEDWKTLDGVNLSESWYNQSANRAFDIAGKQYVAVSDLTYTVQQHFRFLCNLELLNDLGLEKPYALVDSGDWTLEALNSYVKNVYADLDSVEGVSADDRYGLYTTVNGISRFLNNWNESPCRTTDDGFAITLSGDRLQTMLEKMNALQHSPDTYTADSAVYTIFNDGRALFEVFSSDPDLLRDVRFDFAYLPYPKYDTDQENYITVTHGGTMVVPSCCQDLARAGNVIEALTAASSKHIRDAFVESYFSNRILRDADSVRMYRLMRDTAYFDVARYIDPSGKLSTLSYFTDLIKNNDNNLDRQYQAFARTINQKYADFWKALKGN